jgi:hypothetical protein
MEGSIPVFSELIESKAADEPNAILTVFETGEVFWIPLDKDPEVYRTGPTRELKSLYSNLFASLSRTSDDFLKRFSGDHVCFHSKLDPLCIEIFVPCQGFPFKVEFEPQRSLLIIQGILQKQLPSIGVFEVAKNGLSQIFVESLVSISDICYCSYFQSLLFIPRGSPTPVCLIPVLTVPPETCGHRVIPEICFAGSHLKRTVHISGGGRTRWHAVSWSDDMSPTIILWHFSPPKESEKRWEAIICDFYLSCFVYHVTMHPSKSQIGFLMELNGETVICVWQIEKRQIMQWNLAVQGIEQISSARWVISTESSDVVFAVSAKSGYYEHRRDVVVRWDKPIFDLATVSRDGNGRRYFFGKSGELRMIGPSEFFEGYEVCNAVIRVLPQIPLMKNYMEGDCDVMSCMHMHRCAECRRPLLYPLVSKSDDGLTNCYCSPACQAMHWPQFLAIREKPKLSGRSSYGN